MCSHCATGTWPAIGLYLKIMQQFAQQLVLCAEVLQTFSQLQQKNVWGLSSNQEANELVMRRAFTSEVVSADDSVPRIVQVRQRESDKMPQSI